MTKSELAMRITEMNERLWDEFGYFWDVRRNKPEAIALRERIQELLRKYEVTL